MTETYTPDQTELSRLKRKLEREIRARQEAEKLLEEKSANLFDLNQQLAAEASRASQLIQAVESASDGVAITDAEGLFTYMNRAHAVMFGYRSEDLTGQHWSSLYSAEELRRFDRLIMPELERFGFWRGETVGLSKHGQHILQEIVLTQLETGGLICATRDITLRHRAQMKARELEQRLVKAEQEAALFTLGNAVAHDFNNLIGVISGYAMLIQHDVSEDSEAHGFAERIAQAAEQATGVIRSLEVERTNDTQSLSHVNLTTLSQTGLTIAEAIRPPAISINANIPEAALVWANEVVISRCLLNITKNAFDAMGSSGELSFSIVREPSEVFSTPAAYLSLGEAEDQYEWIIEISDTGPGMSQDKLNRIFDPFFTSKSRFKGSGLGLLSLISLVESQCAFIEVSSHEGQGTQFRLNIKKAAKAAFSPIKEQGPARSDTHDKTRHILIIDDTGQQDESLNQAVEALDYTYETLDDPALALDLLEGTDYSADIILANLDRPGHSHAEMARQLRTARPDLPLILCTQSQQALNCSADFSAIVYKPIEIASLRETLKNIMTDSEMT